MRQEISAGKRGRKSVWDDPVKLQALYAEFGEGPEGERHFNELLDTLSLMGDWGERTAKILKARQDGQLLEAIAADLGMHGENVHQAEKRGLQALREMRQSNLVALPRLGDVGGSPTIWSNPQAIVEHYGGQAQFDSLLGRLEGVKSDERPNWGKRLADVLRRLMAGEFQHQIAPDYEVVARNVGVSGYQALEALDVLAVGGEVKPPSYGEHKKIKKVNEIMTRYGSEDIFWRLIGKLEDVFWQKLGEKVYDQAWQVAEGLAILRAHVGGKSLKEIGKALGGGEPFQALSSERVHKLEKWALENLDRLQRGEEVRFRKSEGRLEALGRPRKN